MPSGSSSRIIQNQMKGRIKDHECHGRRGSKEADGAMNIWDCGSPLYDSYEVVAVSHLIERNFIIRPYVNGSRKVANQCGDLPPKETTPPDADDDQVIAKKGARSSVLSFLSGIVEKNGLKRKKTNGERKENAKKLKVSGFSKIFQAYRIRPWNK